MLPSSGPNKISTVRFMLFFLLLAAAAHSWGAEIQGFSLDPTFQRNDPQKLSLITGKSIVLSFSQPISRMSEPDPNIAQTLLLSPYEIYITPKGVGVTNLILWQNNNSIIYDLEVSFDTSRFKQRLHEVLPLETELRVIPPMTASLWPDGFPAAPAWSKPWPWHSPSHPRARSAT